VWHLTVVQTVIGLVVANVGGIDSLVDVGGINSLVANVLVFWSHSSL
jgi:hypothetical protein